MFTVAAGTQVTPAVAVELLQELDREIARLHSRRAELLVAAADLEPQIAEFLVRAVDSDEERTVRIQDGVREELAAALRQSPSTMQGLIDTARTLVARVPEVLEALRAGELTYVHARIIADAAERLPEDKLDEFVRRVLPTAKSGTPTRTRARVNAVITRIDRDGQERRRERAKEIRDVWVAPDADGMSLLVARLTSEDAIACKAQIDANTHARGEDGPIGIARVATLMAMVLGDDGASPRVAPRTAHVSITIDLPTLLDLRHGLESGIADLVGAGPVPTAVVRDLLSDPDCAVTLRRLVTDPVTGHLLDHGRRTYEIPQALRDYIVARDRTCRFPGCGRRADLSQIDHAIAWDDGGSTSPPNLGALCTRHHQLKTFAGWDITDSRPDGSCTWRSPLGREYWHYPPPNEAAA